VTVTHPDIQRYFFMTIPENYFKEGAGAIFKSYHLIATWH